MSSDNFHPEFGYLSPSPQFRRSLRVGVFAGAFGVGAGILVALAVVGRPAADFAQSQTSASSTPTGQPAAAGAEGGSTQAAVGQTADGKPAPTRSAPTQSAQSRLTEDPPKPRPAQERPPQNQTSQNQPARAPSAQMQATQAPSESSQPAQAQQAAASQPGPEDEGSAAATTGLAGRPSRGNADKPCKESTWPYFDSDCLWGKTKRHVRTVVPERDEPAAPARSTGRSRRAQSGRTPVNAASSNTAQSSSPQAEPHNESTRTAPAETSSSASSEATVGSGRRSEPSASPKRQKGAQSRQRKPSRARDEVDARDVGGDDAYDAHAEARADRRIDRRFPPRDEPRVIIRRGEPRYESHDSFFPFAIFGGGGGRDWADW